MTTEFISSIEEIIEDQKNGKMVIMVDDESRENEGDLILPAEKIDDKAVNVDIKTPDSKESHRNLWTNVALLTPNDQVKFVICSREDYEWARFKLDEYALVSRVSDVLFSPSHHDIAASDLADWIVADRLPVRFQMQLHKILWNDEPGR